MSSAKGRGARSAKAAEPRDLGAEALAGLGPGREGFTVGSARRSSRSALLFPAAAEAAAAEEAAARPAPPPPAGAIPRRLVGGRARGGRGREQSCALARRLRALPFSACSDAAFLARIFS